MRHEPPPGNAGAAVPQSGSRLSALEEAGKLPFLPLAQQDGVYKEQISRDTDSTSRVTCHGKYQSAPQGRSCLRRDTCGRKLDHDTFLQSSETRD